MITSRESSGAVSCKAFRRAQQGQAKGRETNTKSQPGQALQWHNLSSLHDIHLWETVNPTVAPMPVTESIEHDVPMSGRAAGVLTVLIIDAKGLHHLRSHAGSPGTSLNIRQPLQMVAFLPQLAHHALKAIHLSVLPAV